MTDIQELKSLTSEARQIRKQIRDGITSKKENELNKELDMILKRTYKIRKRI
ncbi:MAG: hypothetical protein ACE5GR_03160 [Nitrosopumilus sp.]